MMRNRGRASLGLAVSARAISSQVCPLRRALVTSSGEAAFGLVVPDRADRGPEPGQQQARRAEAPVTGPLT